MKTLSKIIIFFFLFLGVLGVSTAYGNQPSYNPSPTAPLENDKSEDAQPENDEEDFQGHYRQKPVICSYEIEKVFIGQEVDYDEKGTNYSWQINMTWLSKKFIRKMDSTLGVEDKFHNF